MTKIKVDSVSISNEEILRELSNQRNVDSPMSLLLLGQLDDTEAVHLKLLNISTYFLKHIQNPSKDVILKAIDFDYDSIKYIHNPSEDIQLEVVNKDIGSFSHIKNPSHKVILNVLHRDGLQLKYVKDITEEYARIAVQSNGRAIRWVQNPSEELQLLSLKESEDALVFMPKNIPNKILNQIVYMFCVSSDSFYYTKKDKLHKILEFENIDSVMLSKMYSLSRTHPDYNLDQRLILNHPNFKKDAELILSQINNQ